METVNLESWESETKREAISVEDMDQALVLYEQRRTTYEAHKKITDQLFAETEEAKEALIAILEASGKSAWEVEGVGKVSLSEKMTVKVPSDLDGKRQMLD